VPKSEDSENTRLRKENARLQKSLDRMEKQLQEANDANKELRALMKDLQEKLDILIVQFKKRNRKDFGSKTERHNPRPALADELSPLTAKEKSTPKPRNHIKHILSQNLPPEIVPHTVKPEDATCPHCIVDTVFVGTEVTHQLERLTQTLKHLQHEQEVRACPKCRKYIVTAEKPCSPIPGSYAGPGLLADVCVNKLADGLPNYRQEKRYKRESATIPRSTQSDWMLAASFTVEPLYDLVTRRLLLSRVIQTDDSELKVQDRKHKRKMRKGKMTVYRGDENHRFVAFDFSPDQTFARNVAFLEQFVGIVQADAAKGFDKLYEDGTKVEAGCNAHSRRKYYEALVIDPQSCNPILDIYHELYDIEAEIKTRSPAEKLAERRARSKPLVGQLHALVLSLSEKLNPKHPVMRAVLYTLTHWQALTRFLEDPAINIDNNAAEREIKDFVIDRKNFLFAGSDAGGKSIAILLTLIASAKRNKIDPRAYLTDVFTRINSMKTSELEQLLPDRWTPNQNKVS
jgi:transposase